MRMVSAFTLTVFYCINPHTMHSTLVKSMNVFKKSRVFNQRDLEKSRARTSEMVESTKKVILTFVALAKDSKLQPPTQRVLNADDQQLQQSVR